MGLPPTFQVDQLPGRARATGRWLLTEFRTRAHNHLFMAEWASVWLCNPEHPNHEGDAVELRWITPCGGTIAICRTHEGRCSAWFEARPGSVYARFAEPDAGGLVARCVEAKVDDQIPTEVYGWLRLLWHQEKDARNAWSRETDETRVG